MRTLQMGSHLRIFFPYHHHNYIQDSSFFLSSSLLVMPVGCLALKLTLFWAPSLVPSFLPSLSPSSLSSLSHPFSFWYLSQCCEAFLSTCPYQFHVFVVPHNYKVFKQLLCSSAVKTSPYMFGLCHNYHNNFFPSQRATVN